MCYLLVLGFLSLNPWVQPASKDDILSPDKLMHGIAYGGLPCLKNLHFGYFGNTVRVWMGTILISSLIGVLLEIAQSLFTYNRTGSVEDAVANTIGVGLGYIVYHAIKYIGDKMVPIL